MLYLLNFIDFMIKRKFQKKIKKIKMPKIQIFDKGPIIDSHSYLCILNEEIKINKNINYFF